MIEIGKKNRLTVDRFTDHGAYLTDGLEKVLLPKRYLWGSLRLGEELEVFVYNDSEDRPTATTEMPVAQVGDIAVLEVVGTNRFGAFLDWGLPKDLLVPFKEQKVKMRVGGRYPVYIYLDDASRRVVASAKIGKFLGNVFPKLRRGDEVQAIIYEKTPLGWHAAVDGLFEGMIYENEVYQPIRNGETLKAYVKNVRPDGKIDLYLGEKSEKRTSDIASRIYNFYISNDNHLPVNDNSSPEEIKNLFHCSKKDFKKAIGQLLKERKIDISDIRKVN